MNRDFLFFSSAIFISIFSSGPALSVIGYKGVDMSDYEEEATRYPAVGPLYTMNAMGETVWSASGSFAQLPGGAVGVLTAWHCLAEDNQAPRDGYIVIEGEKYKFLGKDVVVHPNINSPSGFREGADIAFALLSGPLPSVEPLKLTPISDKEIGQKKKGKCVGFGVPGYFTKKGEIRYKWERKTLPAKRAGMIEVTVKGEEGQNSRRLEAVIRRDDPQSKKKIKANSGDSGGPLLKKEKIVGVCSYGVSEKFSRDRSSLDGLIERGSHAAVTPEFINYVQEEVKKRLITKEDLSRALKEVANKTPLPASVPVQEPDKINIPVGQAVAVQ